MVVGNTPFVFDADGICTVVPKGRGGIAEDFKNLLKLNGVTDVSDGDQGEGAPATTTLNEVSRHADSQEPLPPDAVMKPPLPKPKAVPVSVPPGVPTQVTPPKAVALSGSTPPKKPTTRRKAKPKTKGDS
jgi:hypothetical protein